MPKQISTEKPEWTEAKRFLYRLKLITGEVLLCSVPLWAQQTYSLGSVKKVYVERFTVKKQGQKLREDVVLQLRKLNAIAVVSDISKADAILSGGGEIWIRGYQSLNPRSGRLPSDGTPVYSGFLSVELKDTKGETLWSDLVTPEAASEDISKELSKRLEKHLSAALVGHAARARP